MGLHMPRLYDPLNLLEPDWRKSQLDCWAKDRERWKEATRKRLLERIAGTVPICPRRFSYARPPTRRYEALGERPNFFSCPATVPGMSYSDDTPDTERMQ